MPEKLVLCKRLLHGEVPYYFCMCNDNQYFCKKNHTGHYYSSEDYAALEARVKELEDELADSEEWAKRLLETREQAYKDLGRLQDICKKAFAERDKLKVDVKRLGEAAKRLAYSFPLVDGKYQIFVINNTLISYLAERIDDIKEALAAFKEAEDE